MPSTIKAKRLEAHGAEVIHLGNCMVGDCPSKDIYIKALQKRLRIPFVERTHGGPSPAQMAAYKAAAEAKKTKAAAARKARRG
ncbi:MAG: hypothetical protein ACYDG5_01625 [Dehalococcoidales bacterium]